jgi:hypothetical protein
MRLNLMLLEYLNIFGRPIFVIVSQIWNFGKEATPPVFLCGEIKYCGGFIKGILRGVRCTKSLRVLFLPRRPPSWTTLVLYSRAVFIFNEPAYISLMGTNYPQGADADPPPPLRVATAGKNHLNEEINKLSPSSALG